MADTLIASTTHKMLAERIRNRTAVVGIVGLGYVGLPLALTSLRAGFRTIGFDVDEAKVRTLQSGGQYLRHIDHSDISSGMEAGRFEAVSDFFRISDADVIIICVPTPLGPHNDPDLSYIAATMEEILPYLRPGQLVSLESSTYPGTTEEYIARPIREQGFAIGEDLFVVYSPEREDPGNPEFSTGTIPKVVGGATPACLELGSALYGAVVDKVVPVSSPEVAEMTKLLENIYRAVNIGLVNELKTVADRMGMNIWDVIEAAATKPFGFKAFFPGPGLGGHCIPIDPFYLTWKARELGVHTRFIELAGEVNSAMPEWVVQKLIYGLSDRGVAIRDARVLVLGVAYKPNIDDVRESPAVEIIDILTRHGAEVSYCDPHVPSIPPMRHHDLDMSSVEFSEQEVCAADCVLIATDHDAFDYEMIYEKAQLIVDTRGRYREPNGKIIVA